MIPGTGPQPTMPQRPMMPPPPQIPPDKINALKELISDPSWEDVEVLLRDDAGLCFRVDIETDSTIRVDQEVEKAGRIEFLAAASGFMKQMTEIQDPRLLPLAGEMLMFGVRGFKAGRELESSIENVIAQFQDSAQNQNQKPNPEMQKIQAESQARSQELQLKAQLDNKRMMLEAQNQAQSDKNEAQQDVARTQAETQRDMADAQNDAKLKMMEAAMDAKLAAFKESLSQQTAVIIAHINAASRIESSRVSSGLDNGLQPFQFEQSREGSSAV